MAQFNVDDAITHAQSHAEGRSQGYCARYTANAIDAGLSEKSRSERPRRAYHFSKYLEENGFVAIPAPDSFQKGDVVIIDKFDVWAGPHRDPKKAFAPIDNPSGHMAIYDGEQWVSDFKQKDLMPGPDYRFARPSFTIYRHSAVISNSQK